MVSALLVRLVMVALTLAALCGIGWSVPSESPEPSQAAGLKEPSPPSQEALLRLAPSPGPETSQPRLESHSAAILDLNRATEQDIERLPGIGPVLARRIVGYRASHGAFLDIEQLRRVKGIGQKKLEQIRPHVAVVRPGVPKPSRKTA